MQQALALLSPDRASKPRLVLAAIGCLGTAGSFLGFVADGAPGVLALPALLLAGCSLLLFRPHLPSQLLVRAALWSNLLLGTLIAISSHGDENLLSAMMAFSAATGLLALGRHGLDAEHEGFAPVAFRGSLVLALVMALADAQSLALFGGLRLEHEFADAAPLLGCAALMLVALVGLFYLRTWAVVLNIFANLMIAGLACTGQLELPNPIILGLCSTAIVQLVLPIPMISSMVRGRTPEAPLAPSVRAWIVPATVFTLSALTLLGLLSPGRLMGL